MSLNQIPQVYRAQIGAIIVNSNKQFLLIQNHGYPEHLWEFVKGGMHKGESEIDTLNREICEELGDEIDYQVLRRSGWNYIYEWPKEDQLKKGMRGQARLSYWVFYKKGKIKILEEEIKNNKWFNEKEFFEVFKEGKDENSCLGLFYDWQNLVKEFKELFK